MYVLFKYNTDSRWNPPLETWLPITTEEKTKMMVYIFSNLLNKIFCIYNYVNKIQKKNVIVNKLKKKKQIKIQTYKYHLFHFNCFLFFVICVLSYASS